MRRPGWAAGGGHSLQVVADLTLASREHARFKQTDSDVGRFDGGYGSAYLARQIGQKFAREIFFLGPSTPPTRCRIGGSTRSCPTTRWSHRARVGRDRQREEPNRATHAEVRVQLDRRRARRSAGLAGETARLAYMTDEAAEGRYAFLEKRPPDWTGVPYHY